MGRRGIAIALGLAGLLGGGVAAWWVLSGPDAPPRAPREPGEAPTPSRASDRAPGQIRLSSEPVGARISVDGEDLGRITPDLVDLPSRRRHRIRLHLEGFEPSDLEIRLDPGEIREIHVDLAPIGPPLPQK